MSTKKILTVPNLLTLLRIIAVPFIVWQIVTGHPITGLIILACASATDVFDGYIARRFDQVSELGKILDPFADKLMHVSTLISLAIIGYVHYAFPIIFAVKELSMVICGLFLAGAKNATIMANWKGKVASAVITVGLFVAFFVGAYAPLYWVSTAILALGVIIALIALADYFTQFLTIIKKRKE